MILLQSYVFFKTFFMSFILEKCSMGFCDEYVFYSCWKEYSFCRCLLSSFDLWWGSTLKFICWCFCLEIWISKTHTIIISELICPFMSSSVSFMKLGSRVFNAYVFTLVISSCGLFPLLICSNFFIPCD
jgi:hypothetical protein